MPKTKIKKSEQVSVRLPLRVVIRIKAVTGPDGMGVGEFLRLAGLRELERRERKGG